MLRDRKVGVREKGEKFHANYRKRGLNGHERDSKRKKERGRNKIEREREKKRQGERKVSDRVKLARP